MTAMSQSQRSLMSEDSGLGGPIAMEDHSEMWVSEAQDLLDKHQLDEAEALFSRVLQDLTDANPEKERLAVSTLVGMGEIYSKRSRSMRYNLLEWYRMLMRAATFQEEVQVLCQKVLDEPAQGRSVSTTWLEDMKSKSSMQLNALEECLVTSMQNNVKHAVATKKPDDPDSDTQVGWLRYLQIYCCERQDLDKKVDNEALPDIIRSSDSDNVNENEQVQPVYHRKINFDQVQSAIMTLVKDITTDLRRRHRRKKLTEETLKRSLSIEMVHKLSPAAEQKDIIAMFENAIIYEESEKESQGSDNGSKDGNMDSEGEDEAFLNDPYPMEIIHTEVNSCNTENHEMCDSDTKLPTKSSTFTVSGTYLDATSPSTQQMGKTNGHSSYNRVNELSLQSHKRQHEPQYKRSFSDPPMKGQPPSNELSEDRLQMPGILTVWRSYNKPDSLRHPFRRYTLHSFEEVSPLTDTGKFFETPANGEHEGVEAKFLDQNLLSEDRIKNTLGYMIAKVGEKLQKESKSKEALQLYKFAMGLFQELPISQLNPNVIGTVLKNTGMIKCQQGDIEGGSQLMEEAMVMFGAEEEDSIYTAEVLYELGNAYMAEHWKDSSLFDHVMRLVMQDIDNEIHMSQEASGGGDVADDSSDSDCSDSGESYTVCTHEAMSCYNQALSILSRLRKKNEEHTSLYVDVLTKLADCCIIVSDYDRAILCYEEALYLFRNALGSASLPNNAHVLSMLGTTNFLLANYPKAVSMYETAHILQQHLLDGEDVSSFGNAFTLTMLGMSFYTMKHYQKCIVWCLRAYDTYKDMYKEHLITVETLKQWFIIQTLYTMGFAYSTLSFHEKSLEYLFTSRDLLQRVQDKDIKQLVRVLKSVADVYNSMEDHPNALEFYKEALEESHELGDERTATALQNQLLNKIAGVHVSTKQYSTAAEYLEQALDYQKNVQSSIHGDLLGIMHQLGITYTLSGDIDRAIECYRECYETYQDLHGPPLSDMTNTLCNLGTLYHVKACIQDEGEMMEEEYLQKAEECYQEAFRLDPNSGVSVQYANFLYQQGQSGDALLTMLPVLFCSRYQDCGYLVYNGVEQAVLPDHLQHEMADMDEFSIETRVFANFLAILCYKQLFLVKDAEDCLVHMCQYVTRSPISLNHSLLGYSMLEMHMYEEATESFLQAARLTQAKELPLTNGYICVYLWINHFIVTSMYSVWYQLCKPFDIDMPVDEYEVPHQTEIHVTTTSIVPEDDTLFPLEEEEAYRNWDVEINKSEEPLGKDIRDSGYYDFSPQKPQMDEKEEEQWETTEETVVTSSTILDTIRKKRAMLNSKFEGKETDETEVVDILKTIRLEAAQRYVPSRSPKPNLTKSEEEILTESGYVDNEESVEEEQWVTHEETVETPMEILRTIGESGEITMDYTDDQDDQGHEEHEETWITEESTSVETPMEILKLMQVKGSYLSGVAQEQKENEPDVVEYRFDNKDDERCGLHSEITIEETETPTVNMWATDQTNYADEHQSSQEEEQHYSEEWVTTEEVVETPLEVLWQLQSQSSLQTNSHTTQPVEDAAIDDTPEHEEWVSEEVSVELPEDILKQIKIQQQESRIPWKTETSNGVKEEESMEETWITTEETVEMPPEVLEFIREQEEKQQEKNRVSSTVSTSHQSVSSRNLHHNTSSMYSTQPEDRGYSSYSSRYSRWNTTPDPPATEDRWNESKETIASPTAILNAINGNTVTQSNVSQEYTPSMDTQEYNQNNVNDEEEWETWETSEETVEAPPELLAILAAQQQQRS